MNAFVTSAALPDRVWGRHKGVFEVILAVAVGRFCQANEVPTLLPEAVRLCGDAFHEAWPERFAPAPEEADPTLDLDIIPRDERLALARGARLAAAAFLDGSLEGRVAALYREDRRRPIAAAACEMADFVDASLVAEPPRPA